ncbi:MULTISPECIES: GNAT family N-acetyltransferase [unclassified Gemella]|uniref:GNAT family N-acetyltransferase n=1 Tax=unclassified Gemella TaxID=2624949 RepID=UPI001C041C36|nr:MULTISPECIES: GNAT family N-acetyltransferase [unclassified Gemella]MBU0278391.1 N-acetyltransferase [Gemella sp. zg-1178]QWQ38991.1 N-acetyltransferase [Gemella sp. zg-570]
MQFQLNDKKDFLYYGEDEKTSICYLVFPKNPDGSQTITKVFVDEKYRGQGLAGKLMQEVVTYAKENNIKLDATCSYAIKWFEKNK